MGLAGGVLSLFLGLSFLGGSFSSSFWVVFFPFFRVGRVWVGLSLLFLDRPFL